jgi:SAM-dependent methyltransferase
MGDLEDFVTTHLPDPPSQVLEIGCGSGELAYALTQRSYKMTAIDPEAPEGAIFQRTSLEEFRDPGPFDAVVASRSLHHLGDIDAAVKKIHALLREEGILILYEFAWDQMDERTVRWYLSHAPEGDLDHKSLLPGNFPHAWITEHEGLHDSISMRRALDHHFRLRLFEWVPYIADYYLEQPDLVEEEWELIASGAINPLAFRYVGIRGATLQPE